MDEKVIERCRRICGNFSDKCFIKNGEQVACIADIIINKASVSLLGLEQVQGETGLSKSAYTNLELSIKAINELVNWVKFLQLSHDLRELVTISHEDAPGKRSETRYPLPEVYQQYISTHIKVSDSYLPVLLLNFSQSGLQFKSPVEVSNNAVVECILTTSHAIRKKVHFKAVCKYCTSLINGEFVVGAKILEVSDNLIFNFFLDVYEFINEGEYVRADDV
jgi:hypothetical protein